MLATISTRPQIFWWIASSNEIDCSISSPETNIWRSQELSSWQSILTYFNWHMNKLKNNYYIEQDIHKSSDINVNTQSTEQWRSQTTTNMTGYPRIQNASHFLKNQKKKMVNSLTYWVNHATYLTHNLQFVKTGNKYMNTCSIHKLKGFTNSNTLFCVLWM